MSSDRIETLKAENERLRLALTAAVKFYDDLGITQPWMNQARAALLKAREAKND